VRQSDAQKRSENPQLINRSPDDMLSTVTPGTPPSCDAMLTVVAMRRPHTVKANGAVLRLCMLASDNSTKYWLLI